MGEEGGPATYTSGVFGLYPSSPCDDDLALCCRDDCLELLSACLDWTNMMPGMSANALCSRLSPESGPCVPLKAFAGHGAAAGAAGASSLAQQQQLQQAALVPQVTTPCKRNPCPAGTVCLVNRGCRVGRHACKPYRCVAGCKAGEVSHYLVPEDTYARVPTFSGQKGCVKICLCTRKGIERCQQVPCAHMQSCWLAGKTVGKTRVAASAVAAGGVFFFFDLRIKSFRE